MRFRFILPALLGSILLSGAQAEETPASDAFAGAWQITFTPDDDAASAGAKVFKDAALFHDNKLSAAAIAMYGFDTVEYQINADNTSVFTATMNSNTQGSLQWAGYRSGDGLVGLLVWTKPGGAVHRYKFRGTPYQEAE